MNDLIEVSDVIIDYDPDTLERQPVLKEQAIHRLCSMGYRATRIVKAIPDRNGILEEEAVDQLLIQIHCEIQRLCEEFRQGARVAELLIPMIELLRERAVPPYRIIDVGCGLGYLVRWLAAHRIFGEEVQLIGADYNATLVDCAQRIAQQENLDCRFVVANAFALQQPASVYISHGVLHHFRGDGLVEFFRSQACCHPHAFFHFDIQPSWIAPLGAWLFHMVRMRHALSRHDGYISAIRAHSINALLEAAQAASHEYSLAQYGKKIPGLPFLRVMHAIVGIQRELVEEFKTKLGRLGLGEFR